jgi:hypothetical protein
VKLRIHLAVSIAVVAVALAQESGNIQKLDPGMDDIVPAGAKVERVATDPSFKWTEGPVWIHAG